MTLTVSQVSSWDPAALVAAADGLVAVAETTRRSMHSLTAEQDALADTWRGSAATAAAERVVQEDRLGRGVAEGIDSVSDALRRSSGAVEAARDHLIRTVTAARTAGFTVADDGTVDASGLLVVVAGAAVSDAGERLRQEALDLTYATTDALRQAGDAAADAERSLRVAIAALEDAGSAAKPGTVSKGKQDEFTWMPDVPATAAASSIGLVTDATSAGLASAATATGDDLARTIGRGLGPFGAALGTVPAVVNDIEGGMDPTEAIVTEGAGAAAGLIASIGAGAAVGSIFPGAGTGVGVVVGVVAGGGVGWAVSKVGQLIWE
ncbi:WXG100 family type VII secretion target [Rhodococcus gannanensis]|uniref:WXG100 family type VII secretion target n=1 Tax=Rhodococcus gannanensis TaxID=1960308 RepID=A0ABW4P1I0_9NOCA